MISLNRVKNIVVFGSGTGTNLEALLEYQQRCATPTFEVKALFTDRQSRIIEIGKRENIPVIHLSLKAFFRELDITDYHDSNNRLLYDKKIVELIENCANEHEFHIDLIVLAGYMRLLYSPILNKYPNRIINIHPADLTVLDSEGKRKYIGADAVRLALEAGEKQTRSTVIEVNEDVDGGRIIKEGPWVVYTEGYPLTPENIAKHQEKQKVNSDWPVLIDAVRMLTEKKEVATCVGS